MSYFDDLIIGKLLKNRINHEILTVHDHKAVCEVIRTKANFVGNQINWPTLKNFKSFNHLEKEGALDLLAKTIISHASEKVFFIGDSAMDEAYSTSIKDVRNALGIFTDVPQHLYILPDRLNWIACISSEGNIDFAELT